MRFQEFNTPWKKISLKKLGTFLKGKGISKDNVSQDGIPCILYGELYTTYKNEIINRIVSKTNSEIKNPVYSKKNDVILPSSGETELDISTARCVTVDNVLLGGDINIFRPNNLSGEFLSYQLSGVRKFDIAKIAQGKSIVHLYNGDLKNLSVYYPETIEQNKIFKFLMKIDELIETQSEIIKEKEYQKNLISTNILKESNLFESNIKLSELVNFYNGYAFDSKDYEQNGKYNVITIGNVTGERNINVKKTNKINILPSDIKDYQILQKGDILISMTGNVGRVSLCNLENCVLNQRVGKIEPKNENLTEYIYQCISNNLFEKRMKLKGQGAAQINIGKNDILDFQIPFSENLENIKNYSKLIYNVDKVIEIEILLLTKYHALKKFFLEELFI